MSANERENFLKPEKGKNLVEEFDKKMTKYNETKKVAEPHRARSGSLTTKSKIPQPTSISWAKSSESISQRKTEKVTTPSTNPTLAKENSTFITRKTPSSNYTATKASSSFSLTRTFSSFDSRSLGTREVPSRVHSVEGRPYFPKTGTHEKPITEETTRTTQVNTSQNNDDEYAMDHPERGKAVIFVHKKFNSGGESIREGAAADVEQLKRVLPDLGFKSRNIIVHEDLTYAEIKKTLNDLSKENHQQRDCLMMFVLTHGEAKDQLHAKDRPYNIEKIWKYFLGDACPSLLQKPKIFFFVACRGENTDSGQQITPISTRRPSTKTDAFKTRATYTIPTHVDMLTVYSTVPGHFSYREATRGTWYIEAFCRELKEYTATKVNIVELLTRTNRRLSIRYATHNTEDATLHNKKQCACYTSTLTKSLYIPKE